MGTKDRRDFLKLTAIAAGAALMPFRGEAQTAATSGTTARPVFPSSDARWQKTWDAALAVLAGNVKTVPQLRASGVV